MWVPSFLLNQAGELAGVDWPFNAWGGLESGLYFPWDLDDQVAAKMLQMERAQRFRAPKIIEGGAIHVDGEGTVLVTEACLLNENRNPGATRQEMERVLKDYLGVSHVVWLGAGVPGDETGGHIDNLACFVRPGTVLLSWCDDPTDPHYAVSRDAEARLLGARDAQGRAIQVLRIPMPTPMFITEEEAAGIDHGSKRHEPRGRRTARRLLRQFLHRQWRDYCTVLWRADGCRRRVPCWNQFSRTGKSS